MSDLESILGSVNESLEASSIALSRLQELYENEGKDIKEGVASRLDVNKNEKVSLLSLKNGTMLSYLSDVLSVVHDKMDVECADPAATKGRESSIENRIVLERGVKPLEKKLSYQLDKLIRAYTRMEKEYLDAEKRALEKSTNKNDQSDEEDDEDSSEDEEELAYRPGMVKSKDTQSSKDREQPESGEIDGEEGADEEKNDGVYRPPKINAMLPPQQNNHFEDKFNVRDHKDNSNRSRMQAMEEYIKDQSDQPDWGASIGSDILNHGRGGIKSSRDTEKERRVTSFEEDNFTRVNTLGNKNERRKAKQRERAARVNIIGGEDFSIFNSKRKLDDSTSRRGSKKPRNAWDRAKRRL